MGVIPTEILRRPADGMERTQSLWQRITQALDRFVVDRSQRSIPTVILRRSKYDHDRCRRLMLEGAMAPAAVNRAQTHRAGRTPQVQS